MQIAVLDLEWNAAYSRRLRGYLNEIIEFGAVKTGADLQPRGTFGLFVRPQVGKRLNTVVADLTSITEENLTGGVPFMQAVSRFRRWLGEAVLVTWGPSDVLTLIDNCRYFSGDMTVPFLTRYVDLQRYAQDYLGLGGGQMSLESMAQQLGLDISQMEQHRALDDSLITLRILQRVYDEKAILPYIETCNEEFYRKMTFRTAYVRSLEDTRAKPEYFQFMCPRCGGASQLTGEWSPRNKGFQGRLLCGTCGYHFVGRVQIKVKYEGIIVNRKTFPVPVLEEPREALPGPVGHMELDVAEGVGMLRFPQWKVLPGIEHAFSTRLGGVSEGEFAAMNLGYNRGDSDENVEENYRRFLAAAGFPEDSPVCGCQVHKTDIRRVDGSHRGLGIWRPNDCDSADGLCTNVPGVTLVVYAADCVPIYFFDPEHQAIGLAHAGWRGTAAGMAGVMVRRLEQEFGTRPQALLAAIGPSICRDCFEVDEPVAEVFQALPGWEKFVTGPEHEKYHVDLWECCRQTLLDSGVLAEHITLGNVCTMEESSLLFSHRKTRGRRGSNAAMLALNP